MCWEIWTIKEAYENTGFNGEYINTGFSAE